MTGVCIVGGYYGTNLSNAYASDSSGKVIASGRGRIVIDGEGLATNTIGLALGENTYGGVAIRSGYNATGTESAIVLAGKTISTWPALRFGFYAHDHYAYDSAIQATGTGGISLIGDNPANASFYSIEFNGTSVLSREGDINIDGIGKGVLFFVFVFCVLSVIKNVE